MKGTGNSAGIYGEMFTSFPDVVTVEQLCEMMGGIGAKAAYKLLHEGHIRYFRIGKAFRIPKRSVIDYLLGKGGL